MKVVMMTGDHPRHLYVASRLMRAGFLHGLVVERRAAFVPEPPAGLPEVDRINFVRHFADRSASELRFFGKPDLAQFAGLPVLHTTKRELNGDAVRDWIRREAPDVVLTYGVHVIRRELLELMPEHRWNIHGGLSPWYRGNITLFWPFYFLKPNWAGMTIHKLTDRLDGGDIIHHSVPELVRGDGIHDTACRAVIRVAEDLIPILEALRAGKPVEAVPQKSSGKLFTAADWKPSHLRVIYNLFNNDIVDRFLDGELGRDDPPLVRSVHCPQ